MDRIRKELGPDAVILSNRRSSTTGRVEIIAAAPGEMRALVDEFVPAAAPEREPAMALRDAEPRAAVRARPAAPARVAPESFQEFIRRQAPQSAPRIDALAMYQDVAREPEVDPVAAPMARRQQEAQPAAGTTPPAVFRRRPSRLAGVSAASVPASRPAAATATEFSEPRHPELNASVAQTLRQAEPAELHVNVPALAALLAKPTLDPAPAPALAPAPAEDRAEHPTALVAAIAPTPAQSPPPAKEPADVGVMAELQSLRSALTDRITHLEKQIAPMAAPARQDEDPAPLALKRQAMTRLLMSGFSPELARRLADTVPPELERKETDPWLQNSLAQQIRCPGDAENAIYLPGAVALVGPTGVGKTTTVAKLAARFVVRHGASALGLITLDSYRMGAHEQLRSYGRILGVPVQAAHDEASLRDLLRSMHGKRKVLIDTCGMSQRDQRLGEMLAMLSEARFNDQQIRRVLLVNAASHAETLDEVARAWRVAGAHGAILTKVDEAARIGGGLDALIRYQLPLLGLTNGQRVPEDWHPGNAGLLAHIALKPFAAAFCLDNAEIQALTTAGVALV
jgi:flagellar biosynthesis protein FlhF